MMLALLPAEARGVGGISNARYRIRRIDLAIESQRADEGNARGIFVGAEWNERGEAKRAAENLDIGIVGDRRDVHNEMLGQSQTTRRREREASCSVQP